MRARARWPNVAQIGLTVVVVIVVVVVALIIDLLRRYCCFSKSVTDKQTNKLGLSCAKLRANLVWFGLLTRFV